MSPPSDRMAPLTWRRLTAGERALAAEMFGEALAPARVRILALPLWPRAFVPGAALMVWPAAAAWRDFAAAPVPLQAVFVHELTHVWQAQGGIFLPLAKLKAGDGPGAYAYDLADGRAFAERNIEQQAMIVQHAFLSARGWPAPHPPDLYARACGPWRRT